MKKTIIKLDIEELIEKRQEEKEDLYWMDSEETAYQEITTNYNLDNLSAEDLYHIQHICNEQYWSYDIVIDRITNKNFGYPNYDSETIIYLVMRF